MHALHCPDPISQPRPTPSFTRTAPLQPWLRWLGWLLCWAACLSPLHSAAAAKRIALVIGNAAYQGEKPLRNPVNDANDIAAALTRLGFTVLRHTDVGRSAMNRAISDFLPQAEGAELAVIFYSGHGMQDEGESFLIPTDAQIRSRRDVKTEGVRLGELMADLADKRVRHSLLIIDACRDNPFATRTKSTAKGLARPRDDLNSAMLVAYATADGQTADDGTGRNGTYTAELLKQLANPRQNLRDLMDDTQLAVERTSGGSQRPKNYGDTAKFREVYLASIAPVSSAQPPVPRQDAEDEAWAVAKRRDTAAAYQAYLNRYPSGRYADSARVALEGLQPVVPAQPPAPRPVQQAQPAAPAAPAVETLDGRWQILAGGAEVKDLETGLVWQRCSVGQSWSGSSCTGEAKTYKWDEAQALSGNGWRVPTVRELQSLRVCSKGFSRDKRDLEDGKVQVPSKCADGRDRPTIQKWAFPQTPEWTYWTSSPDAGGSGLAWLVDFSNGGVDYGGRYHYNHVRLVR